MSRSRGIEPVQVVMARRDAALERLTGGIPYARFLGVGFERMGDELTARLAFDEKLIGNPRLPALHGGAISTVMDTCSGAAVMSHPSRPSGTATIDLRIDYMRAATPGQTITARATCYHITRSVAFVRAEARDEDGPGPVAVATGSFTVERG